MSLKFFTSLVFDNDSNEYTPFPLDGSDGQMLVRQGTTVKWKAPIDAYSKIESDSRYSRMLNLKDGTGTGALVQVTYSSSGQPYNNIASGSAAVGFGKNVQSLGNTAFTIGQNTYNKGDAAAVGGINTKCYLPRSVAFGVNALIGIDIEDVAQPFGQCNFSLGCRTHIAGGYGLLAGGYSTYAYVDVNEEDYTKGNSITWGLDLRSTQKDKATFGRYNAEKSGTLLEIGNGTGTASALRSNAFEIYADGRAKVYGTPTDDEDVIRLKDKATTSKLGLVKPDGTTITMSADGTISSQGGGGTDYNDLTNKPSINGVTLSGNKTQEDLNIYAEEVTIL